MALIQAHGLFKVNKLGRFIIMLLILISSIVFDHTNICKDGDHGLNQCFSTAGARSGTGPWHQSYRAARGSPGLCHFIFLSIFHE